MACSQDLTIYESNITAICQCSSSADAANDNTGNTGKQHVKPRKVKIASCSASEHQNGYHCNEATDGIITGTSNGWAYNGLSLDDTLGETASVIFTFEAAADATGVTILSGVSRAEHHPTNFSLEVSVNGTTYTPVTGLAFANAVDGGVVAGNRVGCTGQQYVALEFDREFATTAVRITISDTDAANRNVVITEFEVQSTPMPFHYIFPALPPPQKINTTGQTLLRTSVECAVSRSKHTHLYSHCWTKKDKFYVGEQHGATNECYDFETAKRRCEQAADCHAIATQYNVCDGKYRVTHGGPTFNYYTGHALHAYALDRDCMDEAAAKPNMNLGLAASANECGDLCRASPGCVYFVFGTGTGLHSTHNTTGWCVKQDVVSDDCGLQGYLLADFDLYKLGNTTTAPAYHSNSARADNDVRNMGMADVEAVCVAGTDRQSVTVLASHMGTKYFTCENYCHAQGRCGMQCDAAFKDVEGTCQPRVEVPCTFNFSAGGDTNSFALCRCKPPLINSTAFEGASQSSPHLGFVANSSASGPGNLFGCVDNSTYVDRTELNCNDWATRPCFAAGYPKVYPTQPPADDILHSARKHCPLACGLCGAAIQAGCLFIPGEPAANSASLKHEVGYTSTAEGCARLVQVSNPRANAAIWGGAHPKNTSVRTGVCYAQEEHTPGLYRGLSTDRWQTCTLGLAPSNTVLYHSVATDCSPECPGVCTDTAGWTDSQGFTCAHYRALALCTSAGEGGDGWSDAGPWPPTDSNTNSGMGTCALTSPVDFSVNSVSASDACCACGGGRVECNSVPGSDGSCTTAHATLGDITTVGIQDATVGCRAVLGSPDRIICENAAELLNSASSSASKDVFCVKECVGTCADGPPASSTPELRDSGTFKDRYKRPCSDWPSYAPCLARSGYSAANMAEIRSQCPASCTQVLQAPADTKSAGCGATVYVLESEGQTSAPGVIMALQQSTLYYSNSAASSNTDEMAADDLSYAGVAPGGALKGVIKGHLHLRDGLYTLDGNVRVAKGALFEADPGVEIVASRPGASIDVFGALSFNASHANPITIRAKTLLAITLNTSAHPELVGCFHSSSAHRFTLSTSFATTALGSKGPSNCIKECGELNFPFAGLVYTYHCYCGRQPSTDPARLHAIECRSNYRWDGYQTGDHDSNRVAVYTTGRQPQMHWGGITLVQSPSNARRSIIQGVQLLHGGATDGGSGTASVDVLRLQPGHGLRIRNTGVHNSAGGGIKAYGSGTCPGARGFNLQNVSVTRALGRGLHVSHTQFQCATRCTFDNVTVSGSGLEGIKLEGPDTGSSPRVDIARLVATNNGRLAQWAGSNKWAVHIYMGRTATVSVHDSVISDNEFAVGALAIEPSAGSQFILQNCTFERNRKGFSGICTAGKRSEIVGCTFRENTDVSLATGGYRLRIHFQH